MTRLLTTLAAAAALACGGAALAQGDPSGGSPNTTASPSTTSPNGAMGSSNGGADTSVSNGATPASPQMSKSDMKTMKMCQGMASSAMAKNSKCKTFMSAHPDMFNPDGTMKSGGTPG